MITKKADIIQVIQEDAWMMEVLQIVRKMDLPDWWICAGFVRAKVWDVLHEFPNRTTLPDVDVIYYDESNQTEVQEKVLEEKLHKYNPTIPWSVKNQARMHLLNQVPPYSSAEDAMAKFPETATAIGVCIDKQGELLLTAPHGIADLIQLEVKPTPYFLASEERRQIYKQRVQQKNWTTIWTELTIDHIY